MIGFTSPNPVLLTFKKPQAVVSEGVQFLHLNSAQCALLGALDPAGPSTLKPKNWVRAVILGSGLSKKHVTICDRCPRCFFCKMLGLRKFSQQHLWVDLEDVPTEKTQHLLTRLFDFQRFDPVLFPKLAIGLMIKVEKWAWINMTDQDYMDI